ncbi:MAG TPA: hypothetical protein V6C72_06830, partial [Chroococcales cyanobacterium]
MKRAGTRFVGTTTNCAVKIAAAMGALCFGAQILLAGPAAARETQSLTQLLASGDSLLNGGDTDGAI